MLTNWGECFRFRCFHLLPQCLPTRDLACTYIAKATGISHGEIGLVTGPRAANLQRRVAVALCALPGVRVG